jgi:transcriptional regulator with XRE-family HTH domain
MAKSADERSDVHPLDRRLEHLRRRRDITLSDLAEETGISTSMLSRLEAGLRRPTLEQLLPLARVYGVTLDELSTLRRPATRASTCARSPAARTPSSCP